MVSVGVTPLSLRVKEQQEVVEQLTYKSDVLPLLQQQLAELKQKQLLGPAAGRLLSLVAGTSELNTFLAELDELGQFHQVSITSTEPGAVERFRAPNLRRPNGQAPPAEAGGCQVRTTSGDALLNRGLEKRSAGLSVKRTLRAGAGLSSVPGAVGGVCHRQRSGCDITDPEKYD